MTKVKICGLRRMEDVEAVNRCLPDYVGFVFAESKRQIQPETASALKAHLHPLIQAAGVFVNQDPAWIAGICRQKVIDCVQLHGEEDEDYIQDLKRRISQPVIRSVAVRNGIAGLSKGADYLLFDTACTTRGGSGTVFDWHLLEGFCGRPYFLAGGLEAANVADAIRLLHPYCVDVSSGVETDGWKDRQKIEEFIRNVREIK